MLYIDPITQAQTKVNYGVIPDNAPAFGSGSCGVSYRDKTSYMSHELMEGVTDPNWSNDVAWGGWWAQNSQLEIADNCNWVQCTATIGTTSWTIQKMWSNLNGCVCPGF